MHFFTCAQRQTHQGVEPMATKKSTSKGLATTGGKDLRQFKKTNEAIGVSVVEGNLSLLSRKVFNVMMYHAQLAKVPGQNAPIDTPTAKQYFWIPLSDLARDAAYDSKDVAYFKRLVENLQDVKLQRETERQWTSERLVSSVTLVHAEGPGKHGQVWFGFAFPPEVSEQVMMPSTYTKLSLVYQSSLKSGAALALYEICRRFLTNPSKLTAIQTYEQWYGKVSGNPVTIEKLPEYKYFKRDTLRPAIAEVNALTDITIELIEHKVGRRVDGLQFRVEPSKQPQLEFPAPPIIDTVLMDQLAKMGISAHDASDIVAQYPDVTVRAAIAKVDERMAQKSLKPLDAPAAYLKWALREMAMDPSPANDAGTGHASREAKSTKGTGSTLMEKFLTARAHEAFSVFKTVGSAERDALFEKFRNDPQNGKTMKLDKGLSSTMVRAMFSRWYARELWGEPSAQALAKFVEQMTI